MAGSATDWRIEDVNPARRYKWSRPRQTHRGYGQQTNNTNKGTISLYNDSTGNQILVVRLLSVVTTAGETGLSSRTGILGTLYGHGQPITVGDARGPGAVYTIDTATTFASDFSYITSGNAGLLEPMFPIAVLPPNAALVVQNTQSASNINVSFIYEAIAIEELDYFL